MTSVIATMPAASVPCETLANWSSDSGTGPVRRTATPAVGPRPSSLAAARTLRPASDPGDSAP